MHMQPSATLVDLLRHGQPVGGQMYRGRRDDPLSPLGWEQMRRAGADGTHWDAVLSSSLERCRAFAEEVGHGRGIPVYEEPGFVEISFGHWEGMKTEEILARYGKALGAFWLDGDANPPPGGETVSDFHQRVGAAWDRWLERLWGQHVLLVCHGGVIRTVLSHALGLSPAHMLSRLEVPYACRSRVRVTRRPDGDLLSTLVSHGSR
ncbi:MAG: histidine phosphatase family protein [Ectothiorhodospiraceae bacterium]|nr:histidine phosphatase family protein [Ectothiorhodospiraceae bacterium]